MVKQIVQTRKALNVLVTFLQVVLVVLKRRYAPRLGSYVEFSLNRGFYELRTA